MRPLRTITPRLNHARWILDCPDCPSALLADNVDVVFLCVECGDAETGRGLARVERDAALERAVMLRVKHRPEASQNWMIGESLVVLEQENRQHGLPSEAGALVASPDGLVERL